MIADSRSTAIVKLTTSFPAANHVAAGETNWCAGSSATWKSSAIARAAAIAQAATSGQCAALFRSVREKTAARTAAQSGSARTTSARLTGSDTGGLLLARGPHRPDARGRQERLGGCGRGRQRVGVH